PGTIARHVHARDASDPRLDSLCAKPWIYCPKLQRLGRMDVLSDVLDTVRLSSTVFVRTEISPPWGMRSKPREHFAFHVVSRGTCWLDVDGLPDPVPVAEGDVVVITPGRAHTLRSSPDAIAYDIESLIADGGLCRPGPTAASLV